MKKFLLAAVAFSLAATLFAGGCACFRTETELKRIVREEVRKEVASVEKQKIGLLKKWLFPMYEEMSVPYNKKAETFEDILEPLFRMVERL